MPKPGDPAPAFSLLDHSETRRQLSDYAGKRLVLWFYPRADTPGCTREGCGFRDLHAEFLAKGAEILGVSYDSPADNAAFVNKFGFPYPLLSDPEQVLAKALGAHDPQRPGAPARNTYVVDGEGRLEQVFEGVNPKTHPKALLDSLGS